MPIAQSSGPKQNKRVWKLDKHFKEQQRVVKRFQRDGKMNLYCMSICGNAWFPCCSNSICLCVLSQLNLIMLEVRYRGQVSLSFMFQNLSLLKVFCHVFQIISKVLDCHGDLIQYRLPLVFIKKTCPQWTLEDTESMASLTLVLVKHGDCTFCIFSKNEQQCRDIIRS